MIPAEAFVKVVNLEGRFVEAEWDDGRVFLFAVDLAERGEVIQVTACYRKAGRRAKRMGAGKPELAAADAEFGSRRWDRDIPSTLRGSPIWRISTPCWAVWRNPRRCGAGRFQSLR